MTPRKCVETVETQAFARYGTAFKKKPTSGNLMIIHRSAKALRKFNYCARMTGDDPGTSKTNLGPCSRRRRRAECKTIGTPWVCCGHRLASLEHAQYPGSSATKILQLKEDNWKSLRNQAFRTSPRRHPLCIPYGPSYPQLKKH